MIKGIIQQEVITLVNIYIPNIGSPKYVKQMLDIKREIDRNTVIAVGFNTPLTSIDTFSRQKINKESDTLNNTLDRIDLIDIFRALHPKALNIHTFQVHMFHLECFLG